MIQSTKVELILNLKAAKTLGITFPLSLLGLPELLVASHISRLAFRDAAKSLLSTLVSESSGECRVDGAVGRARPSRG